MFPLHLRPGRTSFAEARLLFNAANPEAQVRDEAPKPETTIEMPLPSDSPDELQQNVAKQAEGQVTAADSIVGTQQEQMGGFDYDVQNLSQDTETPADSPNMNDPQSAEGSPGDAGAQGPAGPEGEQKPDSASKAPEPKKGFLDGITRELPAADKKAIESKAKELVGNKRPVDMTQKQADLLMATVQMQTGATLKISADKRSFDIMPPGSSFEIVLNRVMGAVAFASTLFAKETGETLRERPDEYEARVRAAAKPDSPENRKKIDGLLAEEKKSVAAMQGRIQSNPDDANAKKDLEEYSARQAILERIIAERPAVPSAEEKKEPDAKPSETQPAEPETREKSLDQIKLEAANALAESMNEAAGRQLIRPDAKDWRSTVTSIRGVLTNANAKAPATAALGIGMNGDALEEWDGGVFDIDNDIVSDFGTMLDNDPMQAVMRIMRMDPSFIRAENAKASETLAKMQAALRTALPEIAKTVDGQKATDAAAAANRSEGTSAGSY